MEKTPGSKEIFRGWRNMTQPHSGCRVINHSTSESVGFYQEENKWLAP